MIIYKSGDSAPASGQYKIVGPRGGETGEEIALIKGDTFPPTYHGNGYGYVLVNQNKNDCARSQ